MILKCQLHEFDVSTKPTMISKLYILIFTLRMFSLDRNTSCMIADKTVRIEYVYVYERT